MPAWSISLGFVQYCVLLYNLPYTMRLSNILHATAALYFFTAGIAVSTSSYFVLVGGFAVALLLSLWTVSSRTAHFRDVVLRLQQVFMIVSFSFFPSLFAFTWGVLFPPGERWSERGALP